MTGGHLMQNSKEPKNQLFQSIIITGSVRKNDVWTGMAKTKPLPPPPAPTTAGERLRAARAERGLTQGGARRPARRLALGDRAMGDRPRRANPRQSAAGGRRAGGFARIPPPRRRQTRPGASGNRRRTGPASPLPRTPPPRGYGIHAFQIFSRYQTLIRT